MFFKNLPKGFVSNKAFAQNDQGFRARCEEAGVEPTARQASKYRNGKGSAFVVKMPVQGNANEIRKVMA